MGRPRPVFMKWSKADGVFTPHPSFKHYCDREFEDGGVYPMAPIEERSMKSHNQFFAAVAEGFQNLSEENAKQFPSAEHLRKWSLVQCGYATETNYVMANNKEARKVAIDIRKRDGYAVIKVKDNVVQVWDAESQSISAMKKERFQQSKSDVLDLIASMSRTTRPQLMRNAGRSA